jgi:hypothetical protein
MRVKRLFGGKCRLHHRGRRISKARNKHEAGRNIVLFFDPEDGSDIFLRNIGCLSMGYMPLYPRR